MNTSPNNPRQTPEPKRRSSMDRYNPVKVVVTFVVLSLVVHIGSLMNLDSILKFVSLQKTERVKKKSPLRIKIVPKFVQKKKKTTPKKKDLSGTVIDTKLSKTAPPKTSKYLSHQDHIAKKEQIARQTAKPKGAKIGNGGKKNKFQSQVKKQAKPKPSGQKVKKNARKKPGTKITFEGGNLAINKPGKKVRKGAPSAYQALLPSNQEMAENLEAGYHEYLDAKLPMGDRVDVNTTNYRFAGYFTVMKKSVELVLDYPKEAVRRRIQGKVNIGFEILEDGRIDKVRILESSGYDILDNAWIEAIKLAAPFSPLPKDIAAKTLPVSFGVRFALGP